MTNINSMLRAITVRIPAIFSVMNSHQKPQTTLKGPAPNSGHDPLFFLSMVWKKCLVGKALFTYCHAQ